MPPGKLIAGFFVRFLLVYTLLMVPWPGLHNTYRDLFAAGWGAVFLTLDLVDGVRFVAVDDEASADTKVSFRHRRSQRLMWMGINSRQVGYLPTVTVLSLLIATPIPWSRRRWALLWGLVLVHAFLAARLGILILYSAHVDIPDLLSTQRSLWEKTICAAVGFLGVDQAASYIAGIGIWMLASLSHADLARPLSRGRTPNA